MSDAVQNVNKHERNGYAQLVVVRIAFVNNLNTDELENTTRCRCIRAGNVTSLCWCRPVLYHCSIIHSKIRSTSVENRACTAVKLNQERSVLSCVHNLVSLAVYSKRSVHVLTYVCMSKTVHALHLHAALDSREKSRRVSLAPQSASGPCSGVHRGVRSTTP